MHSTPEVMADISATPSSEKMANPITDYSGDPVTLDDNLGLRPRARAVSGLRPCARAISGSAPRLASVKGDSRMSTTPSSCRLRPCPHRRRDLRYIPDAFSIGPGGGRLNSDACATLHTRYTRCTSTAHPAPCPMNVDTPASHPLCHNRVTWTSLSRRVLSVAMS